MIKLVRKIISIEKGNTIATCVLCCKIVSLLHKGLSSKEIKKELSLTTPYHYDILQTTIEEYKKYAKQFRGRE